MGSTWECSGRQACVRSVTSRLDPTHHGTSTGLFPQRPAYHLRPPRSAPAPSPALSLLKGHGLCADSVCDTGPELKWRERRFSAMSHQNVTSRGPPGQETVETNVPRCKQPASLRAMLASLESRRAKPLKWKKCLPCSREHRSAPLALTETGNAQDSVGRGHRALRGCWPAMCPSHREEGRETPAACIRVTGARPTSRPRPRPAARAVCPEHEQGVCSAPRGPRGGPAQSAPTPAPAPGAEETGTYATAPETQQPRAL